MVARHFLKHAIERADVKVKVHMTIRAGAEAVDKGQRANVQRRPVALRRPRAVGLQALRNHPQNNTQHHVEHCPVMLHEVGELVGLNVVASASARGWIDMQARQHHQVAGLYAAGFSASDQGL
jgi:hypothetical protein